MEWLAPMTGAIAAAAAVPTLVLLYFLKLKRMEVSISSTLLWKRAVQDLQVNAPFQRLRRNILLLLQLLALAMILVALARPVLSMRAGPGKRYVLLIDRSASMNAADAGDGKTRLAAAKEQAKVLVESLRAPSLLSLGQQGDQAMVVAFDRRAKLMCNFTSDQTQLAAAIDAIEPTDGPSSLSEAITVARAFAQSPGTEVNDRPGEQAAQLELFSDGRIADLAQIVSNPAEMRFHKVGSSADNVGVTAMQARRSYEKADEVHVFASLTNCGPEAVACDAQLSLDGDVRAVRRVTVPPSRPGEAGKRAEHGQVSVSFVLSHSAAGVVEVRQLRKDALAADDAAWAVLQPPRKLAALLVTRGNPALLSALKACPLARLDVRTGEEFDKALATTGAAEEHYDVTILDNHAPAKLPRGRYIVFGPPPPDVGVKVVGELKNQMIVDWRSRHPVLQFVNLGNLFAAKCAKMELPRDAVLLAEFGDTPAMALLRRGGGVMLLAAFDVMETNWPFEAGFVMFCYNATRFLGLETGREHEADLRVGDALTVRVDGQGEATVVGPDGRKDKLAPDPSGTLRYPRTSRAGVYAVAMPGGQAAAFAVNLLDEAETDIAPAGEIVLSAETVQAQSAAPRRTNQELWPYLALLGLALVCVEWFVYNSKVRL